MERIIAPRTALAVTSNSSMLWRNTTVSVSSFGHNEFGFPVGTLHCSLLLQLTGVLRYCKNLGTVLVSAVYLGVR